jgi:hypothetical protein
VSKWHTAVAQSGKVLVPAIVGALVALLVHVGLLSEQCAAEIGRALGLR